MRWSFCLLLPVLSLVPAACGSPPPEPGVGGFLVPSEGRIVELGVALEAGAPLLPGELEGMLRIGETTGTHLEAPALRSPGGARVGDLAPGHLVGPLVVMDQSDAANFSADTRLEMPEVESWERANGAIPPGAIVAVRSGWSRRRALPGRFWNADDSGTLHFPGVSEAAVGFLVAQRRILGILVETPRLDGGTALEDAAARALADAGKFLVVNAVNLDGIPASGSLVFVGPVFAKEALAAPARVFALVPRGAARAP